MQDGNRNARSHTHLHTLVKQEGTRRTARGTPKVVEQKQIPPIHDPNDTVKPEHMYEREGTEDTRRKQRTRQYQSHYRQGNQKSTRDRVVAHATRKAEQKMGESP